MEYNSEKPKLIIPEYGRNVQLLVEHAKTIENKEMRMAFVEKVIDLIQQMHPQARNVEDYRAKLWHHVFQIANYELKIEPPVEVPDIEFVKKRPEKIDYPEKDITMRHYGRNVEHMIAKAIEMDDPEKKQAFTRVIGAYMKMAFRTWNRDANVSDDTIKADLEVLSNGKLHLDESDLDTISTMNRKKRSSSHSERSGSNYRRSSSGGGHHKSRGGSRKHSNNNGRKSRNGGGTKRRYR